MSSSVDFHGIVIEKENPEELFEHLSILGKGTFGTVIKARNTITNEIVAIKQILLGNEDEIDIIRKEIRILQECTHCNIVQYRGTYKTINALWITMEFCGGGSVDMVFKVLGRPLPESLIAYICREVLSGLVYLHAHHKIHRDIKGGNVLLTEDGDVKLADFGVSTELLHTLSKRNSFIGTLYWMAPEAIQEKEYDERADLWSLGITVIEMAEGSPPRAGYPCARALFAIPREPPPTLTAHRDRWSPVMHAFVARMLQKDPNKRPTAAQLLLDPFVAADRSGSKEELRKFVEDVIAKSESMTTARRLGEESMGSSATFVQRDDSDDSTRRTDEDDMISSTNSALTPAGQQAPQVAPPMQSHPIFHDGTLLQLPLIHTDDISFDELGAGTSPIAPVGAVPSAVELLCDGGRGAWDTGLGMSEAVELNQTTESLLAMFYYHTHVVQGSAMTSASAERSKMLATRYGSVLKSILRL